MRGYPEESPGRWYSDRYPGESEGAGGYEGYRIPDPRYTESDERGRSSDPLTGDLPSDSWSTGGLPTEAPAEPAPFQAFGGRSAPDPAAPPPVNPPLAPPGPPVPPGPPSPPLAPSAERFATQSIDRGSLHRSGAVPTSAPVPVGEPGGVVYRTRRAGTAALLLGSAILAELLLFRVLLVAEFGARGTPGGVLAGLFGLAGVPLVTMGLYGLMTGAASAGPTPGRPWLRTPLAYLPVGLALLVAAGLAVG